MPSPTDPEERRRRRALLWAHHPDLGGDTAEFIRLLAVLDRRGGGAGPVDDVRFVRRSRGLAKVVAWYRRRRRPPRVL